VSGAGLWQTKVTTGDRVVSDTTNRKGGGPKDAGDKKKRSPATIVAGGRGEGARCALPPTVLAGSETKDPPELWRSGLGGKKKKPERLGVERSKLSKKLQYREGTWAGGRVTTWGQRGANRRRKKQTPGGLGWGFRGGKKTVSGTGKGKNRFALKENELRIGEDSKVRGRAPEKGLEVKSIAPNSPHFGQERFWRGSPAG